MSERKYHLDRRAGLLATVGAAAGSGTDLLNTAQLAAWLAMSAEWAYIGRSQGYGPPFVKKAGKVFYRRGDVIAWLCERSRHRGSGHQEPTASRPRVARRGSTTAA